MKTKTKNSFTDENIRDLLNNSANKTNNNLIFFFSFGLYVFISVINTTDIALLLPRHSFKMPFIDFELGLLHFYVLAPLLLLLLHFNLLFNHYENLDKLDEYKNRIDLNTLNPSLYGFAFTKEKWNAEGFFINIVLYLLLYILPLIIFTTIYIRFADYHHEIITRLHLIFIILDLIFIYLSLYYCNKYTYSSSPNLFSIKTVFPFLLFVFIPITGYLMIQYWYNYYHPVVHKDYSSTYADEYSKETAICKIILFLSPKDVNNVCFPRLVVTEEEMAKISKDAFYIPRHLNMKNIPKEQIEHRLILKHGTRIDLSNRNLRYAILEGTILTRANFKKSDLQATSLSKAHMHAVDLTDANLTDANMREVNMEKAILSNSNFRGVNLLGAKMREIDVSKNSNFDNAKMQSADLSFSRFEDVNMSNVDLRGANLKGSSFLETNMIATSLSKAIIEQSSFTDSNLTGVDFSGVSCQPKNLEGNAKTDNNNTMENSSLVCTFIGERESIENNVIGIFFKKMKCKPERITIKSKPNICTKAEFTRVTMKYANVFGTELTKYVTLKNVNINNLVDENITIMTLENVNINKLVDKNLTINRSVDANTSTNDKHKLFECRQEKYLNEEIRKLLNLNLHKCKDILKKEKMLKVKAKVKACGSNFEFLLYLEELFKINLKD